MAKMKVAYSHNQLRLACESDGPFYCVDCREMVLKCGNLTPHFAHKTDRKCSGENHEHNYAKRLISYHIKKWSFTDRCSCNVYIKTHRFATVKETLVGAFRLDVVAFDDTLGTIEILRTDGQDLMSSLVIQVKARSVIEAAENGTFHVFNLQNFPPCIECNRHATKTAAFRAEQVEHLAKKARTDSELLAIHTRKKIRDAEVQQTQDEVDAIRHALEEEATMERADLVRKTVEVEFETAFAKNRIYLALPQYRKYEALAITPIQWDPSVDWNNPALARRNITIKSGSFWATISDAKNLLQFWRQEYLDANFHYRTV